MNYKFRVDSPGSVVSIHSKTGKQAKLAYEPMVALREYIKGWKPIGGKITSTSEDVDQVAEVAASFYGVPFVPYHSSKSITLDEYLDLGSERPQEWVSKSGSVWMLYKPTGDMRSADTGVNMDLTLSQRMKLVQDMHARERRIWCSLYETQKQTDSTPYKLRDFNCHIIETDYGSAFVTVAVNKHVPNELINKNNDSSEFDSYIQAYKLKGKEWRLIAKPKSGIQQRDEAYALLRDTLLQVYSMYIIPDTAKQYSQYTSYPTRTISNTLLYRGIDSKLFEASMAAGEMIHPSILELLPDSYDSGSDPTKFGELFGPGSYPAIVINGVLFASHISDEYEKRIIYEGEFLKVYYSGKYGDLKYMSVKHQGKEYLVNQNAPIKSLKKLSNAHVDEYRRFNLLHK